MWLAGNTKVIYEHGQSDLWTRGTSFVSKVKVIVDKVKVISTQGQGQGIIAKISRYLLMTSVMGGGGVSAPGGGEMPIQYSQKSGQQSEMVRLQNSSQ